MTEIMDIPTPGQMQEPTHKSVRSYRRRRIIRPLLASIVVLLVTAHPFIAFLSYVLFGMFWDWLIFTHDNLKDSDQLPESCFEEIGITGKQVDQLNYFMVNVRRGAFATSISSAVATVMFWESLSYEVVFFLTYIGITLASIIIAARKGKIIFPYRLVDNGTLVESAYPTSILYSSYYNAASDNPAVNPFARTRQTYDASSNDIAINPLAYQMDCD